MIELDDMGNDILRVRELDGEGNVLREASGWVSALTNYYPPGLYGKDGNRLAGTQPRRMTTTEVQAYARSLLDALTPPQPARLLSF